jgi:glutaredoxin 3
MMSSAPAAIRIYGNNTCAYCGAARMLLTKKGVRFEDVLVNKDANKLAEMRERSGRTSVPQIFIGDMHVGGFDELCELDQVGELDKLLASVQAAS